MIDELVPIEPVRKLLLGCGHQLLEEEGETDCCSIRPPEDVYLTVALATDIVYRRWRERYFLAKPDSPAILALGNAPASFQCRWNSMIDGAWDGLPGEVLAALATWTATRLIRSERVYVWAPRPFRLYESYVGTACVDIEKVLGSQVGATRLRRHIELNPSIQAAVLGTSDPEFPYLIAAYFLFSSRNFVEICFAPDDGSEVYEMHHHDKVIVSIPDERARMSLLAELSSNPEIFTDVSNYELKEEPEDMTDEEWSEGV